MKYLIDGEVVRQAVAKGAFRDSYLSYGGDPDAVDDIWDACLTDEGVRDVHLPSYVEIIA